MDLENDWVFTNGASKDGISYNTSSFRQDNLEVLFANNTLNVYEANFIRNLFYPATEGGNPFYFSAVLNNKFISNVKLASTVQDQSTLETF